MFLSTFTDRYHSSNWSFAFLFWKHLLEEPCVSKTSSLSSADLYKNARCACVFTHCFSRSVHFYHCKHLGLWRKNEKEHVLPQPSEGRPALWLVLCTGTQRLASPGWRTDSVSCKRQEGKVTQQSQSRVVSYPLTPGKSAGVTTAVVVTLS